jgi:NAD+ synthase (glutamine-hydrolysing)
MPKNLSLLMAQINPTVGALSNNTSKIIEIIKANQPHHDIIVFPELALTGYPPEDLLFRETLFTQVEAALQKITDITNDCYVILGHPRIEKGRVFNSASILYKGHREALYDKQHLPNYGVFDEKRYFIAGQAKPYTFHLKGHLIGLCICEDIWFPGPMEQLIEQNTTIIICINASPFDENKPPLRESLLRTYALQGPCVVYVNQVGGQDELVFDGQSTVIDNKGNICARAPAFIEHLQTIRWEGPQIIPSEVAPHLGKEALIYEGLLCGLRDYVEKNNFPGVLLGLSGGIDSALTLALAVDALGPSRVHAVMMPSRYTAPMSIEDAHHQAKTLQVTLSNLPIEPAFEALLETLKPSFKNLKPDTTEENLQARIRGTLLMALSNKTGFMLLCTSNKSETAVGYSTLYGDLCGGYAPLKDILKGTVYKLSYYRNSLSQNIPDRVLTRAPSAELASNQTDQDSLPDYIILDGIITAYMNDNLSEDEIIKRGYLKKDVAKVLTLIKRNEYKRRQAPLGIKITSCAFGRDWRYPITSGFTKQKN